MGAYQHHYNVHICTPHCPLNPPPHSPLTKLHPTQATTRSLPTKLFSLHTHFNKSQPTKTTPLTPALLYISTPQCKPPHRSAPTSRELARANATHTAPPHNSKYKNLHLPTINYILQHNPKIPLHNTYKLTSEKKTPTSHSTRDCPLAPSIPAPYDHVHPPPTTQMHIPRTDKPPNTSYCPQDSPPTHSDPTHPHKQPTLTYPKNRQSQPQPQCTPIP